MRVLQVGTRLRLDAALARQSKRRVRVTGGAGHNCTHERSDGKYPISMRSWAGGVNLHPPISHVENCVPAFVGLGDEEQRQEGGAIYWSNDDSRNKQLRFAGAQLL